MLSAALAILSLTGALGLWLAGGVMMDNAPIGHVGWKQLMHAGTGLAGTAILYVALTNPAAHPASKFGWTAFTLIAAALTGGLAILTLSLRRRPAPFVLLAAHGSIAIAGWVLLSAYFTTPSSHGR